MRHTMRLLASLLLLGGGCDGEVVDLDPAADDDDITTDDDDDTTTNAGAVYVVSGPLAGIAKITTVATAKLLGEASSDYAGSDVACAGDVDGDGANDILTAAPNGNRGASDAGQTYLVLWPTTGTTSLALADASILGTNASDYSGFAVAGGDANGDGYSDILIGAYGHTFSTTDNGATYLMYGP